jgi:hypothetical protein
VSAPLSFEYAAIRVVPRVERGEFLNAGVIVFCLARKFLQARIHLDQERLHLLCPGFDVETLLEHLEAFPKICGGDKDAGPIALLPPRERFHWLVAPRSTAIQISPVHSGLCESPETALTELFQKLVLP